MSDYSRFVSYMYLYENAMKTMNAGFVKVESRNGQCRISLSLKNVYTGLERCQVYMFIRFGQDLRGVYIGDVQIKNHGSEWNFKTDTMNIAGSGYRLDQMSGMIIRGEGEKFYGTRWDHGDLDIRRFVTQWDDEARTEPADIEMVEPAANIEAADIEAAKPDAEIETVEAAEAEAEAAGTGETSETAGVMVEPEMTAAIKAVVAAEAEKNVVEMVKPAAEAERNRVETDERRRNFGKILDQCPGMYPFEDDSVETCVRLEPQDIGRMPIDCWAYGSNSFLLHGYYSYRHLILARLKQGQENGGIYILGVPGTQHSREAFMANMFGFRQFKPIREGSGGASDFGYWYTVLA